MSVENPLANRRQVIRHTSALLTNGFVQVRGGGAATTTIANAAASEDSPKKKPARIAVIGAGWWSQGWHLPQLDRNPKAEIAAIVQHSEHPSSKLAELKSRTTLSDKYNAPWYEDITDVFNDKDTLGPIDGVVVATPHSTHYEIGRTLLAEAHRRRRAGESPLHVLMEKPMTADVDQAKQLHDLVAEYKQKGGKGCFLINHSANYREKAKIARQIVEDGKLGCIQHISAFFASPLMEIFDDPDMKGWNEPQGNMIGNGFAWGQIAHMLGYLFHVIPDLQPRECFCRMSYSDKTGADVAHSATILCSNCDGQEVVLSLSGTALVPGGETEGVGKQVRVQIYGKKGALLFAGNDNQANSGHMELRRVETGGKIETPAGNDFYFENTEQDGIGPESLQIFVAACNGEDYYDGASTFLGLKTVQTIHAMYRSAKSMKHESVEYANVNTA